MTVLLSKSKSAEAVKKMAHLACLLLQAPAESLSACGHESVLMPGVRAASCCGRHRPAMPALTLAGSGGTRGTAGP